MSNQYISNNSESTTINLNDDINLVSQHIYDYPTPGNLSSRLNPDESNNIDIPDIVRHLSPSVSINPSGNTSQIQEQDSRNMSQTAQIVLLPTQNINLANVQKQPEQQQQQQVQFILPTANDVAGYQIAFSNVGVLVPTTILITDKNECILIPQNATQNIPCPNMPLESSVNNHMIRSSTNLPFANQIEYESIDSPQEQECEFITLENTNPQTAVLSGMGENQELNPETATQLMGNNCQIVGIIGANQVGIIQNEPNSNNQVLLTACIETDENVDLINQQQNTENSNQNYDINAFLESTISSDDKSDGNKAKEWFKDSYIVNRALKALKKANTDNNNANNHQTKSHNYHRPCQQQPISQQTWR